MSIHHEYDFLQGIGAYPSRIRLTAPVPWGEFVFIMDGRRDLTLTLSPSCNARENLQSTLRPLERVRA